MAPRPRAALLCLLAAAGCGAGAGAEAELTAGSLAARLGSRATSYTGEGWLKTADGYALRLDRLELGAAGLALLGPDGAPLVVLPAGDVPVSARAAPLAAVPLGGCEAACAVEGSEVAGALLSLPRLRAEGAVIDRTGRRLPAQTPFSIDLPFTEPVSLRQALPLGLPAGPLRLGALVDVSVELGDGVRWAALPRDGGRLCLGAAAPCESEGDAAQLRRGLATSQLSLELAAAE